MLLVCRHVRQRGMADDYLSVLDAARHLRFSERFVREAIYRHQLPAVKLGKCWKIKPADLCEFVAKSVKSVTHWENEE